MCDGSVSIFAFDNHCLCLATVLRCLSLLEFIFESIEFLGYLHSFIHTNFRRFLAIISSNIFSFPFDLSCPSGIFMSCVLLCLMVSSGPLVCVHFSSSFTLTSFSPNFNVTNSFICLFKCAFVAWKTLWCVWVGLHHWEGYTTPKATTKSLLASLWSEVTISHLREDKVYVAHSGSPQAVFELL